MPDRPPLRSLRSHARSVPALAVVGLAGVLVVVAPGHAAAQPAPAPAPDAKAPDANEQEAQQLFLDGRELVKKGDLRAATEKFQRSHALLPKPGTLLNLASVEEQLGKLVEALEHFEGALKLLPEGDERRPVATEGAERVRPRVPSLRIDRAAGAPADMGIRLDGTPLAESSLGAYRPLDPGSYTISTSAPGHEDRRYEVKLAESNHTTVAVEPGARMVRAIAPDMARAAARPSPIQLAGMGALGVGLAGIVTGAVTGILTLQKKGDASSACPDPSSCTSRQALDAAASGQALAGVSTASFVVGLAGAAAGVALLVAGRERPAPQPPAVVAAPWILPGGAGLGLQGRF